MRWLQYGMIFSSVSILFAYPIGGKNGIGANGPLIHATYFLTPTNQAVNVRVMAYVGTWENGICNYYIQYPMGNEKLRTGDYLAIDANLLKSVIGGGASCMSIYYYINQLTIENFSLTWNGVNYLTTSPATVQLLVN